MNDDAQLIRETLAGHSPAFGRLVQKYQHRLYNTVVHVAGNADDARGVVQDAFVRAFVKLDTFKGSSAFYTWLYRIALNVNACRRPRPNQSVEHNRETGGNEPIDTDQGPDEAFEQDERHRQVRQAIDQLPEEYRPVVVLREIDGCQYETIADILDLPIGTVRSRLHCARLLLRDSLKEVLVSE